MDLSRQYFRYIPRTLGNVGPRRQGVHPPYSTPFQYSNPHKARRSDLSPIQKCRGRQITLPPLNQARPPSSYRSFHGSAARSVIKPFLLPDIGEGVYYDYVPYEEYAKHLQASRKYKLYNGLSSPRHGSSSSTKYARSSQTRQQLRYAGRENDSSKVELMLMN